MMFPRRVPKSLCSLSKPEKRCYLLLFIVLLNIAGLSLLSHGAKGGTRGRQARADDASRAVVFPKKAVVLFTRWRSGSTFMGELMKMADRGIFYSYEPLSEYGPHVLYENIEETHMAVEELKNVLRCQFDSSEVDEILETNPLLREACETSGLCKNANKTGELCKKASLHVAKVLRLGLRWARPLLEWEDVDVKVIYMVRDPRAVFSSRARVPWCSTPTCNDLQTVCSMLTDDLEEASFLQRYYPNRFHFILYDQFCQTPFAGLRDLMTFLGLPVTRDQERILQTKLPSTDPLSIYKNSTAQAQLWREKSSFPKIVVPVQRWCWDSLETLGLRVFYSEKDLVDLSLPVVLRPVDLSG
ncbi:carbohydrate sulfotransferase 6-like isoform X2 [Penaeus japonicus]|uniref:carbohydrate sulfotransferase 6-like isoform X2 n=1 Tax=Penaeus japonicus TaxID=27405 RepID=UPI001C70F7D3|nr:carbohydrate sulfotransferase 6-like isoform X2 [Penaeus japonicus]